MFKRGFTIIELLIVIAVIAILMGIALPRFKGMQDEGKITQAKGELRTLQTAVESYYIHNSNTYPANIDGDLTDAVPNIIGALSPADAFNGTSKYGYATDGETPVKYYVIYSVGIDGDGAAAVDADGDVTETNGSSCVYVTNGATKDAQP